MEKEAGAELTTNFDQVPRLRMSGALPAFSHTPSWRAQAHIYTYLHHRIFLYAKYTRWFKYDRD